MQIRKTTWELKTTCPDCGQGYPTFCFCPSCGFVTVMCNETGDTFVNPRKLEDGFVEICPKCGDRKVADFETADSDQIKNSGFNTNDYQ
jgi:hypothetical protein